MAGSENEAGLINVPYRCLYFKMDDLKADEIINVTK